MLEIDDLGVVEVVSEGVGKERGEDTVTTNLVGTNKIVEGPPILGSRGMSVIQEANVSLETNEIPEVNEIREEIPEVIESPGRTVIGAIENLGREMLE